VIFRIQTPEESDSISVSRHRGLETQILSASIAFQTFKNLKPLSASHSVKSRPRNSKSLADFFHRGLPIVIERLGNGDLLLIENFWPTTEAIPVSESKVCIGENSITFHFSA
jgi:hypothetical protein